MRARVTAFILRIGARKAAGFYLALSLILFGAIVFSQRCWLSDMPYTADKVDAKNFCFQIWNVASFSQIAFQLFGFILTAIFLPATARQRMWRNLLLFCSFAFLIYCPWFRFHFLLPQIS